MFAKALKLIAKRLSNKANRAVIEQAPAPVEAKPKQIDPRFVMEDVGPSPLVFYRNMLRSMKIVVPKWLQEPVTKDTIKRRKAHNPFRASTKAGWWNAAKRGYRFGVHGELRRNNPKRDKSISARQWRIRRNRIRQARLVYNDSMSAQNR